MEVDRIHYEQNANSPIQNNWTSKAMKPSNDQNFQLNSSSGLVEAPNAVLQERLCINKESTQVSSSTKVDMAINDIIKKFQNRLCSSKNLSQEAKIEIEKEARKEAEDEINTIISKERENIKENAEKQISGLEEALKKSQAEVESYKDQSVVSRAVISLGVGAVVGGALILGGGLAIGVSSVAAAVIGADRWVTLSRLNSARTDAKNKARVHVKDMERALEQVESDKKNSLAALDILHQSKIMELNNIQAQMTLEAQEDRIEEGKKTIEALGGKLAQAKSKADKLINENKVLSEDNQRMSSDLEELKKQQEAIVDATKGGIVELRGKADACKEQMAEMQATLKRAGVSPEVIDEIISQMNKEMRDIDAAFLSINSLLNGDTSLDLKKELAKNISEIYEKINKLVANTIETLKKVHQVIEGFEKQVSDGDNLVKDLKRSIARLDAEIKSYEKRMQEASDSGNKGQLDRQEKNKELAEKNRQVLMGLLEQAQGNLETLKAQTNAMCSQNQNIQNLIDANGVLLTGMESEASDIFNESAKKIDGGIGTAQKGYITKAFGMGATGGVVAGAAAVAGGPFVAACIALGVTAVTAGFKGVAWFKGEKSSDLFANTLIAACDGIDKSFNSIKEQFAPLNVQQGKEAQEEISKAETPSSQGQTWLDPRGWFGWGWGK